MDFPNKLRTAAANGLTYFKILFEKWEDERKRERKNYKVSISGDEIHTHGDGHSPFCGSLPHMRACHVTYLGYGIGVDGIRLVLLAATFEFGEHSSRRHHIGLDEMIQVDVVFAVVFHFYCFSLRHSTR